MEATSTLATITDRLTIIKDSLSGFRNMNAKRQLKALIANLDDLYNDVAELELSTIKRDESAEYQLIKKNAIRRVIEDIEGREKRYANSWCVMNEDYKTYTELAQFDGFLFLDAYLKEKSKDNKYPMDSSHVANYIVSLIRDDIHRKNEGLPNNLDYWTGSL
ncbi:hypothetical protein AB1I63_04155 [Streptococcus pneumoniae]